MSFEDKMFEFMAWYFERLSRLNCFLDQLFHVNFYIAWSRGEVLLYGLTQALGLV